MRVFHNAESNRHDSVEIPVFTGMTVFRGVLRIVDVNSVVIRWRNSRLALQRAILKHLFETRLYELNWPGYQNESWYGRIGARF